MDEKSQNILMSKMSENLPTLRKKLDVSQQELASMIGVSRLTIINIENGKRSMTWNTFLSLILIFSKNDETDKLLTVFEIYTDELNDMIKNRSADKQD